MGGLIGSILTAIFADKDVVTMSGDDPIPGGWINQNVNKLVYSQFLLLI